ncbi:MAG: hypothetical protein WAP47_21320, partial [Candidatus Rokuibacteriota bacterium]
MKSLLAQRVIQRIVIQLNGERFLGSTVHDTRHKAGVTQAAARTRALHVTLLGDNFDLHFLAPNYSRDQEPEALKNGGAASGRRHLIRIHPMKSELTESSLLMRRMVSAISS